ncbi:MAG: hypothetical protein KKH94_06200 [Candidatus Omnitrophica bacterium]|nr:hypothetical protein [Candidatus Omnitrophota bacterium]
MPKDLNIQIADIPISLVLDESFFNDAASFFSPYLSETPAEYTFSITKVPTLPEVQSHDVEISMQDSTLHCVSEEYSGHIHMETKKGEMRIREAEGVRGLVNFLKEMCSIIILFNGGLVRRAAGIVRDEKAYLFFGPSLSGKSTIARCSQDYSILSDELIAIRRINDSFKAYSIPVWQDNGKEGESSHEDKKNLVTGFPIVGLFKLVKDNTVSIQKFEKGDALAAVFTLPFFFTTHPGRDKILACYFDLVSAVPCYDLHFLPDDSFWKCIDECIN